MKLYSTLAAASLAAVAHGQSAASIAGSGNSVSTGNGNDAISVIGNDNQISAGGGDDVIVAIGEGNTVNDGAGNDQVVLGAGDDTVVNGEGNDKYLLGDGDDTVTDGAGNDVYRGNQGDDEFTDGDGNDTYRGGKGSDTYVFDLTSTKGKLQRVTNFQRGARNGRFNDEIKLLNLSPEDVRIEHKEIPLCISNIIYTRPDGSTNTVRVRSRQGCLDVDDLTFVGASPEEPSTLPDYTIIREQTCMGDYAYINEDNPEYDPAVDGTIADPVQSNKNPLRWLRRDTLEETEEDCARVCSAHDECIAFNIVHTGKHNNGHGKTDTVGDSATCYFRSRLESSGISHNANRHCYRILPEIRLVTQESRTACVEDETYMFTDDYRHFMVDHGCRGYFQIGGSNDLIHAESWNFQPSDLIPYSDPN